MKAITTAITNTRTTATTNTPTTATTATTNTPTTATTNTPTTATANTPTTATTYTPTTTATTTATTYTPTTTATTAKRTLGSVNLSSGLPPRDWVCAIIIFIIIIFALSTCFWYQGILSEELPLVGNLSQIVSFSHLIILTNGGPPCFFF